MLANKILVNPEQINIAISKPAEGILQQAYVVYDNQKLPLLKQILKQGDYKSVIIFASTKESAKKLEIDLRQAGVQIKSFHSDLEQNVREEIMRQFKNRQLQVLIGTDILSRGIDVDGISLVINYDTPNDPEDYIHRVGRTARAESTGTAITFINEKDQKKFFDIESLIGNEIPKLTLPEALGTSPAYEPERKRNTFDKPKGKKSFHKAKRPNKA
jgi:superfamily II DNA/RNA helicase